ncbi:MAG: DUF1460 domain-containing protein [Alphaproteobacteria bacterium]|nr:DUF1460 domain-containing protein [Alphaproteobacteria bacterium]
MWRGLLFVLLIGCSQQTYDDYTGGKYLGAQYLRDPLGEGAGIDPDPLIRFDAFDCTTFVETSVTGGDKDKLNHIRYKDGVVDFINRNHFIETDWLPNNSDKFENVSAKYATTAIRTVTIDKKSWFKKVYNIDTNFEKQTIDLEYIPYKNAQNIRVTEPMVVLFVNAPGRVQQRIGTDLAVRHMGILLPNGNLRHASIRQKQVVEVDFNKYVNQMMENQNKLGIMLLRILK